MISVQDNSSKMTVKKTHTHCRSLQRSTSIRGFHSYAFAITLLCSLLAVSSAESTLQCFELPVTVNDQSCKNINIHGQCVDDNPALTLHHGKVARQLNVKLECPPKSKYHIEDVVFSIPQKESEYCMKRCIDARCDCCSGNQSSMLCMQSMVKDVQLDLAKHCENLTTSYCIVQVDGVTFDNQICPGLEYQCQQEDTNFCYSRWVEITYRCEVEPLLSSTSWIIIAVVAGVILLIILIIIIRKCVCDRRMSRRPSYKKAKSSPQDIEAPPLAPKRSMPPTAPEYSEIRKYSKGDIEHSVPSASSSEGSESPESVDSIQKHGTAKIRD